MTVTSIRTILAGILVAASASACQSAARPPVMAAPRPGAVPLAPLVDPEARPELVRQPYSAADVKFMQGMIPHHAQAVVMAGWAPTNGASPTVQLMCERMLISQRDEIAFMRTWLRDRGQEVPAADATHMKMNHDGMVHDMLMPGMLNEAEMAALKKARGKDFDRLFLVGMIKHHQGAIGMVQELFASHGAAQDDFVYLFAADVQADQEAEIERMQQLLETLGGGR
jgi:uncharacterized protein (DUF305 family)